MTQSNSEQIIQAARAAIKAGQPAQARKLLAQIVQEESGNEQAWLWLSAVVEGREEQLYCLQRVLRINPQHLTARRGVEMLKGRTTAPAPKAETPPAGTPALVTDQSPPPQEPPSAPEQVPPEALAQPASPFETAAVPLKSPAPPRSSEPAARSQERPNILTILAGLLGIVAIVIIVLLAVTLIQNRIATQAVVPAGPTQQASKHPRPTATPKPPTPTKTAKPPTPTKTAIPEPTPTLPPSPTPMPSTDCPVGPFGGARVECFDIFVPEDPEGDPNDTIRLPVVLFHSRLSGYSPYPIVFLQGGPGGSALDYLEKTYDPKHQWYSTLLYKHDLIFFDQRGTGYAEPSLQCWELLWAYTLDIQEDWDSEQRQDAYFAALRECRDRLVDEGANLSAYTTAASAADVVAILDALGYEQADLYGVSYGTRLAMAVMRDFPERVHSAILDSPVPLHINMYLLAQEFENEALQTLFQNCAADAECQAAFPGLEQVYDDLVSQFNKAPVEIRFRNIMAGNVLTPVTVDGDWLRSAVSWGLRSSFSLSMVPQMLYDARAGDYTPLAFFLYLQNYGYCGLSLGMSISVECREEILPLSLDEFADTWDDRSDANMFLAALDDAALLVSACQEWGVPAAEADERLALSSDIPTLVLAGEYDPVTPPSLLKMAQTLSQGYPLEIPGAGHVPSVASEASCVHQILDSFLAEPNQRPDSSCLAELDSTPFLVPASPEDVILEPYVDSMAGIKGLRPEGWRWSIGMDSSYFIWERWWLDPTQVAVQSSEMSPEDWLALLTTTFIDEGFDEQPEPAGQRQANGLTWHLYTAKFFRHPVDLALAEGNGKTLLVFMLSEIREHDTMVEQVFLPMVDAVVER